MKNSKNNVKIIFFLYFICLSLIIITNIDTKNYESDQISQVYSSSTNSYSIVDTAQTLAYDSVGNSIGCDNESEYFGQDANFKGNEPNYQDNGDGTIYDIVTGLTWQKDPGDKKTWDEANLEVSSFSLGGYSDWRIPSIKELYSLIIFNGTDVSGIESISDSSVHPFIDTNFFEFQYGDTTAGERIIDSQYMSSTRYVSTTMNGDETLFGVNFADGRIKGYPLQMLGSDKEFFVMYVRGNVNYGLNDFIDNGDDTISDSATGLMWSEYDSGIGMNWLKALEWVQNKNSENYLGYNDWRLPNAKELQSIVNYSLAPDTNSSAAIDLIFNTSTIIDEGGSINYPFFWTSTTHATTSNTLPGVNAAYIAFGEGLGWMQDLSQNYVLLDVHGAGCQRSDPKAGDASDYPHGHGPQGDVIRIKNYVRLVRGGIAESVDVSEPPNDSISGYSLWVMIPIFTVGLIIVKKKLNRIMY